MAESRPPRAGEPWLQPGCRGALFQEAYCEVLLAVGVSVHERLALELDLDVELILAAESLLRAAQGVADLAREPGVQLLQLAEALTAGFELVGRRPRLLLRQDIIQATQRFGRRHPRSGQRHEHR